MDCGVLINLYFKRACCLPEYNPAEIVITNLCFNKHFELESCQPSKYAPSEREEEKEEGGRIIENVLKNSKKIGDHLA